MERNNWIIVRRTKRFLSGIKIHRVLAFLEIIHLDIQEDW